MTGPDPDRRAESAIDANEHLGEALIEIGMAVGLPKPRPGATWGAPEILATIRAYSAPPRPDLPSPTQWWDDPEQVAVLVRFAVREVWWPDEVARIVTHPREHTELHEALLAGDM